MNYVGEKTPNSDRLVVMILIEPPILEYKRTNFWWPCWSRKEGDDLPTRSATQIKQGCTITDTKYQDCLLKQMKQHQISSHTYDQIGDV